MNNKQRALIGGSALLLVLSGWAYSRASGEVITVCVAKDGLMHVIGEGFKRADCKDNQKILSWNMQGEKGEKGDKGDKGDQGIQGIQGIQGEKGDKGEPGSSVDTRLFDYELVSRVDPCTLKKKLADGWQIKETSPVIQLSGFNSDCKFATMDGFNDILFQREQIPSDNPRFEYQIVHKVDPCSLKQLTSDGWQIKQTFTIASFEGKNADCQPAIVGGFADVLFQRKL